MSKEKFEQNPLPEEGMGRREFIKKCLVGSAAVAAASAPFVGRLETAEASESIVTFDTPNIISTLPDDVIVHQNFMVQFAENGQTSFIIEKKDTNGNWQESYPSFGTESVCGGIIATNMVYTDPGDIASPGQYRFKLSYAPDGGGAEETFEGPSFEIVDPDPVDTFDSTTGILNLPSVEVDGTAYKVELQWDEGIQGFKLMSYEVN
jgi:hypothetical protein